MSSQTQKSPAPWALVILFFVILVSVLIGGYLYYYFHKRNLLSEKQVELSAISDLKIRQINQWQLERIGDGKFLEGNVFLVRSFSKFLTNSTNKQLLNDISESLKPLLEYYDYTNVLLIDLNGDVRLVLSDQDTLIGDHLRPLLDDVILNPRVVLTDLHRASEVSSAHLDLIIPLVDNSQENSLVIGLLVIRVDSHKFLYPLIQLWPTRVKQLKHFC